MQFYGRTRVVVKGLTKLVDRWKCEHCHRVVFTFPAMEADEQSPPPCDWCKFIAEEREPVKRKKDSRWNR